jgi:hypothetical protein
LQRCYITPRFEGFATLRLTTENFAEQDFNSPRIANPEEREMIELLTKFSIINNNFNVRFNH